MAAATPALLPHSKEDVERSLRSMAFSESLSALLLRQRAVPAMMQVLRLSLELSAKGPQILAAEATERAEGRPPDPPCPLRDAHGVATMQVWPAVLLLQCDTLIGLGAFAAAHPREALEDLCASASRVVLSNVLGLQDFNACSSQRIRDLAGLRVEELLRQRMELTFELLKECIPVVKAMAYHGPTSPTSNKKIQMREFTSILQSVPNTIDRIAALYPRTRDPDPVRCPGPLTCPIECPPSVETPPYQYDLWPWTEGRRGMGGSVAPVPGRAMRPEDRDRDLDHDSGLLTDPCTTYRLGDVSLADKARAFELEQRDTRPLYLKPCSQDGVLSAVFRHLLSICQGSPDSDFSSALPGGDPKDMGSIVG
jgi:hypothetical protein